MLTNNLFVMHKNIWSFWFLFHSKFHSVVLLFYKYMYVLFFTKINTRKGRKLATIIFSLGTGVTGLPSPCTSIVYLPTCLLRWRRYRATIWKTPSGGISWSYWTRTLYLIELESKISSDWFKILYFLRS